MSRRKTFFVSCLILSMLCLAAGYGIARQWVGAAIVILVSPAWLLARKYPASQLPLVCLLGSVGFGVFGTLRGAPPSLMIFASVLALAAWDLLYLDFALGNTASAEATRRYENKHLQSLWLALGSGLAVTLPGRFLRTEIPFTVLVLFLAFLLFALDRVWGYIKKTGRA